MRRQLLKIESFTRDPGDFHVNKYTLLCRARKNHCIFCIREATKKIYFQVPGAVIVEKYCDECSKILKFQT